MHFKAILLIFGVIVIGMALAEIQDEDFWSWYAKVFGYPNEKLESAPRRIIQAKCRKGFIRIGRRCLPVVDYTDE